jgi:uncharacterized protein YndB with AHSA1/START domain
VIRFTTDVHVERPPEDVFAYISDPAKLGEWQGTDEVEQLTSGPVGKGTRFREIRKVAGRASEQITEVAEYDPPRVFAIKVVEGPVPVDGRWVLAPDGNGTRLELTATGTGPKRLRFADTLLAKLFKARFAASHKKLKHALEATPSPR